MPSFPVPRRVHVFPISTKGAPFSSAVPYRMQEVAGSKMRLSWNFKIVDELLGLIFAAGRGVDVGSNHPRNLDGGKTNTRWRHIESTPSPLKAAPVSQGMDA
ncbi:hypothetical protein J3458_002830 [Metarhizium acridum]|uniref:uncharacterized protein n=1 Tax=Metarhizium acridum TaxID=92637 RepID=UPI001C6B299B|nr:hypothetical protein J3458_002830 [Metarhizium acridum]